MATLPLAVTLDVEMLGSAGVAIAPGTTPDRALPIRRGRHVSQEICGRLLVRYMLRRQLDLFAGGSTAKHYVTPHPLIQRDVPSVVAPPPAGGKPRSHAMLIDPARVDEVQGPRRVQGGSGIEYILPRGFPATAVFLGWELEVSR